MNTWEKLLISLLFWFMTELALSYIDLDELADYSEFLQGRITAVQPS